MLNIGSELEEELEAKLTELEELNLEQNLESMLSKQEECDVNPLVTSQSLTDCTIKTEMTSQLAKLQENARGKSDILKLLKWPREGMM